MYASGSRAGVHKKLKQGKLTAFCFHVTRNERSSFGYQKKLKEPPYVYIPVIECKQWLHEIDEHVEKADWNDDFLDYDPKDKNRKVKYAD